MRRSAIAAPHFAGAEGLRIARAKADQHCAIEHMAAKLGRFARAQIDAEARGRARALHPGIAFSGKVNDFSKSGPD